MFPEQCDLADKLLVFGTAPGWGDAIGTHDSVMVLFKTVDGCPEPVGAGEPAASGKDMPQPETHGTGQRLRVDCSPVHLTRLQLHHPVEG